MWRQLALSLGEWATSFVSWYSRRRKPKSVQEKVVRLLYMPQKLKYQVAHVKLYLENGFCLLKEAQKLCFAAD